MNNRTVFTIVAALLIAAALIGVLTGLFSGIASEEEED